MMRWLLFLGVMLLSGCSGENEQIWSPQPQSWQDVTIRIETRPAPIRQGMNEFILIANHQQRGFVNDLLVEVHTEQGSWKQAMPDGALGVFRRALPVHDIRHDHLFVRLSRGGEHGEMVFALAPSDRP